MIKPRDHQGVPLRAETLRSDSEDGTGGVDCTSKAAQGLLTVAWEKEWGWPFNRSLMPLQSRKFVPVTGVNGEGYLFQTSFIVKSTLCQAIQIKLACHLPPSPDGQGADDVTLYASILAWIRTDVEYNE